MSSHAVTVAGCTICTAILPSNCDSRPRRALKRTKTARRAREAAESGTLRQLFIDGYVVGHLERHRKKGAPPKCAAHSPNTFSSPDPQLAAQEPVRSPRMNFIPGPRQASWRAGRGRTAVKVRSYGAAAYQLAISSRTNPEAPLTLRTFAPRSTVREHRCHDSLQSRARPRSFGT